MALSFSEFTSEKKPQPWISFIYGSLAGGIGQTTSYPLDIVRRRMQTIGMWKQSPESYRTIWSSLKIIYELVIFLPRSKLYLIRIFQ